MKTIGRILLFVASILMGVSAVMKGIDCVNTIRSNNWGDVGNWGEMIKVIGTLLLQGIAIVFVLAGIVAALKGEATLKLTLLSFILLLNVIITFMDAFNGVTEVGFHQVFDITITCLYPILYILGSFLIRF